MFETFSTFAAPNFVFEMLALRKEKNLDSIPAKDIKKEDNYFSILKKRVDAASGAEKYKAIKLFVKEESKAK